MAETNTQDGKKILVYLVGAFLVIGVLGFFSTGNLPFLSKTSIGGKQDKEINIRIKDFTISAEVANTDEKRRIGLSDHESLAEGKGMLFTFDEKDTVPAFWMKDMTFAIDIIWINDDKIVQIDEANPELGVADQNLTLYKPTTPVDYVLEVAKGYSVNNEIRVGDSVDLSEL